VVERNVFQRQPGSVLKGRCTGHAGSSVARRIYQRPGERNTGVLHRTGKTLPGRLL